MNKKHLLVLCFSAFFAMTFLSCTETSLDNDDVQIEKDKYKPPTDG